ncbi:MAG: hypothetical protein ABIH76_03460 [Candidatus Bathyarchaeota archaeon]
MSELEKKYETAVKDAGYEPFEVLSEKWGIYALVDGSYLKLRANVIKIARQTDASGNINFTVNSNLTIGVISPKNLRGAPSTKPATPEELSANLVDDDVDFTTVKEEWSKFKLQDGTILSVKAIPIKVARYSLYDPAGEPHYNVNNQLIVKAKVPEELRKKGVKVQTSGHPTFIT